MTTTILFSISIILSFLECYINGFTQCGTFRYWVFLIQHHLEIHQSCCMHFFFTAVWYSKEWMYHNSFVEQLTHWLKFTLSLMDNDVEHLFMWLFVICVSSLVRCLPPSLLYIFCMAFLSLTIEFWEFFRCSRYQSLSNMWFEGISFQSVAFLFIHFTIFFHSKIFLLGWRSVY